MMALRCCCLLLLCVLLNGSYSSTDTGHTAFLERLVLCLEKVVAYYKQNYSAMNLDGIYGLRVLEGQLSLILERLNHPPQLVTRLSSLHQDTSAIAISSLSSLQKIDARYLSLMRPLVEQPMTFSQPYVQVDISLRYTGTLLPDSFDEAFSDACMSEIMGTNGRRRCGLSAECTRSMLAEGASGYTLTHQMLYTMMAEMFGCSLPIDYKTTRASMCASSFYEVAETVQAVHGNIIPRLQDLFLEEAFVCPVFGYMQFLHNDWLRQILTWQKPNGCFGSMPKSSLVALDAAGDYDYLAEESRQKHGLVHGFDLPKNSETEQDEVLFRQEKKRANEINSHWTRKLLEERALSDGCLSHKTAVAIAALSQYLKFMLDPGEESYGIQLNGRNYLMEVQVSKETFSNHGSFVKKNADFEEQREKEIRNQIEDEADYAEEEIDLNKKDYGLGGPDPVVAEVHVPHIKPQPHKFMETNQEQVPYTYYEEDDAAKDGDVEVQSKQLTVSAMPAPTTQSSYSVYLVFSILSLLIILLLGRCVRHRRILIHYRPR